MVEDVFKRVVWRWDLRWGDGGDSTCAEMRLMQMGCGGMGGRGN